MNLGVRGRFTLQVLRHYGLHRHAQVIGCPSHFINPDPDLGQKVAARLSAARRKKSRRIAVVAGHESWADLAVIDASLCRLANATPGSFIGQHGLAIMKLLRGEAFDLAEEELERQRSHFRPDLTLGGFLRWSATHGRVFFDIPQWMEHLQQFDLVAGTRIHGTVLALQAGVPAVCVAHDSRTLELCQTMRVPSVRADAFPEDIDEERLLSLCDFEPWLFDHNRRVLCRNYVSFLRRNGLQPVGWLAELAHAAPILGVLRRARRS